MIRASQAEAVCGSENGDQWEQDPALAGSCQQVAA